MDKRSKIFRWKAVEFIADNLPSRASSVIQCNLLSELPLGETSVSTKNLCCFCKCVLTDAYRTKLLPKRVLRRKMRKLVRHGQAAAKIFFTKPERTLYKKCIIRNGNTMAVPCSVCCKTRKYPLAPVPKSLPTTPVTSIDLEPVKKKKKKKDPFAGLVMPSAMMTKTKPVKTLPNPEKTMRNPVETLPAQVKIITKNSKLKLKPKVLDKPKVPSSTSSFIKKLKSGNKLAGMLANEAVAKEKAANLAGKKHKNAGIFALLR